MPSGSGLIMARAAKIPARRSAPSAQITQLMMVMPPTAARVAGSRKTPEPITVDAISTVARKGPSLLVSLT